jgi:hypothetical protein
VPGKLGEQRLLVERNGQALPTLILNNREAAEYSIVLPDNLLRARNVLSFATPDAVSPRSLGVNEDQRRLGINVQWMEFKTRSDH